MSARARQIRKANKAFKARLQATGRLSDATVPGVAMTPDELQGHLSNRSRGGRVPCGRAVAKTGRGKGNRTAVRRAACLADW